MRRRLFLIVLAGVLACTLAACARERVAEPGDDGAPGTSQTAAERVASVARIVDLVGTIIPDHLDPPEDADAQIVVALRKLPELDDVEAVPGGVWAQFDDGEELFIINSRGETAFPDDAGGPDSSDYLGETPGAGGLVFAGREVAMDPGVAEQGWGPPPGTREHDAASSSIPSSKRARLINTMGTAFINSVPVLRPWLTNAGYDVVVPSDGSVETLRGVTGDGVVYFSGHGQIGPDHVALWTTTPMDTNTVRRYRAEIASGHLTYGIAAVDRLPPPFPGGVGLTIRDKHLLVTERFVRDHWRPAPGALIYLDACHSFDHRLVDVLLHAPVNTEAVIGWTDTTFDDLSTASTRFYFDRVLGANATPPYRNPPQRPFDGASVLSAMAVVKRKNGLTFDTSAKLLAGIPVPPIAKLQLRTRGTESTHVLRPSIAAAGIQELADPGWLELTGDFGSTPGTVRFNGQSLPVQAGEWSSRRIRCDRPPDGAGFSGEIVVEVGGHRSNPRRITGWNLDCSIHWQEFGPTCPDCQWDATWRGALRADVDLVRSRPETRPRHGIRTTSATTAQQLVFDAVHGSYRIRLDTEYDVSWSRGSAGTLPVIGVCTGYLPRPTYVGFCFMADPGGGQITLQPAFETKAINALYVPVTGSGDQAGVQAAFANFFGNSPGRSGVATLDSGYHIIEGEQPGGLGQSILRWTGAAPQHPPLPTLPK